jgi:hypothetical protein
LENVGDGRAFDSNPGLEGDREVQEAKKNHAQSA